MPVSDCSEANRGVSSRGRMSILDLTALRSSTADRRAESVAPTSLSHRPCAAALSSPLRDGKRALYQRPDSPRVRHGGLPARRQAGAPRPGYPQQPSGSARPMPDDFDMRRRRAPIVRPTAAPRRWTAFSGRYAEAHLLRAMAGEELERLRAVSGDCPIRCSRDWFSSGGDAAADAGEFAWIDRERCAPHHGLAPAPAGESLDARNDRPRRGAR